VDVTGEKVQLKYIALAFSKHGRYHTSEFEKEYYRAEPRYKHVWWRVREGARR